MERENWATRAGFVLAAIGSAIGLGNIWRFGYLVYKNGGGAFLIPYFVALFVAGISLMILEFAIGHRFRGSAPASMRKLGGRGFEWIGWWAVTGGLIITMYYTVVIGWAIVYFTKSLTLAWGEDTGGYFFGTVLQLSDNPWDFGGFATEVLIATIIVWALNWLVDFRGIRKGIEKANLLLMPLLWLLAVILVIRAVTLPGAMEGIEWYLKPDFSKLGDYNIWLAAFGQIFFTLSLGMGIMIAYASYLPEKSDIANNAFIVSLANCAFSFLVGFAVFGTLGYMAYATQSDISDVVAQSVGLAFVVFPKALNMLPALKVFTAAVFFLALVVAGLSSSISLVEAVSSALMDKFGMERRKAVNIVVLVGFLGSIVYTTKAGLYWLDVVDHFINYYGLVLVGLLEVIAAAWLFDLTVLKNHINSVSEIKVGMWWDLAVKFATPLILAVLLILDIRGNLTENYGGYPTEVLLTGLSIIVLGMIVAAILSWRDKNVS
ncbi:sodium-dependent transporter [Archaeoglobus fulgidus]|nr:sodium-dependent transporter [Archaeoglobus fulgidus]AIG98986.1 Na+-dependent transporter of the SNF family [Archaeoglobus fulgidus DSM 8774]KUJ93981.1 MAG: Transporter [Archaeoglobus fulgidus]KUK07011.1 MAG: Transporter [Archaeoglobus fulgidus]